MLYLKTKEKQKSSVTMLTKTDRYFNRKKKFSAPVAFAAGENCYKVNIANFSFKHLLQTQWFDDWYNL